MRAQDRDTLAPSADSREPPMPESLATAMERLPIVAAADATCVVFRQEGSGFLTGWPGLFRFSRVIRISCAYHGEAVRPQSAASDANADILATNGVSIALADASIDLFIVDDALEFVLFPPAVLADIHRVLKTEGRLIVAGANKGPPAKASQVSYSEHPNRFWHFDYDASAAKAKEFFDIQNACGFDFSGGSAPHAADDPPLTAKSAPAYLFCATKRLDIDHHYAVETIEPVGAIVESGLRLPLPDARVGLLLDQPGHGIGLKIPAGAACVCLFFSHAWSGIVTLGLGRDVRDVDLYNENGSWSAVELPADDQSRESVAIAPAGRSRPDALDKQVIFYSALAWSRVRRQPSAALGAAQVEPSLFQPGYGYQRFNVFVGTTVFHWFGPAEGNLSGPWQPLGGRASWDGSVGFWRSQIRDIMMANIDAIYLHLIRDFEQYRVNFFKAYAALRSEGWDVPKLAPFLDPFGIWREKPIDLGEDAGRQEFADEYIRFYVQYFDANTDAEAANSLLTVDGKLTLTTWWTSLLLNVSALSRAELERLLRARLEAKIPQLAQGVYMMTTALIDPDLIFSDERMVMFAGYAYAIHSVHNSIDVWHVQAGYWDQNIRWPGYMLPRDGGDNYRRAWDIVAANFPHMHRVYIESWNEYDEGSGIYAAEPDAYRIAGNMTKDTFSHAGDPYEYIMTTAHGAARINGRPSHAAKILSARRPNAKDPATLVVHIRNEGNEHWTSDSQAMLRIVNEIGSTETPLPIAGDGFADRIVRGQVVCLTATLERQHLAEVLQLMVCHRGSVISEEVSVPDLGALREV